MRAVLTVVFVFSVLLLQAQLHAEPQASATTVYAPDVIVLILADARGDGQISVNYSREISDEQVQADVAAIVQDAGWDAFDLEVNTRSASSPGAIPTTSATFWASALLDPESGVLVVAPFINALKRLANIEIDYVQVPPMDFRGPKDFENRFVKIEMSQNQGSFRYRINVKDSGFDRLDIPVGEEEPTQNGSGGMSAGARCVWIVATAVIAAALAYILAMLLSRKKRLRGT